MTITVETEPAEGVSLDEVKRVADIAEERCPGMECMEREIPYTIEVVSGP